jgi:hypothetical protein
MGGAAKSYKTELVGVFGYPVAENPTGMMQEAALQTPGLNWRYLTIDARSEEPEQAMIGLRAFNMQSINLLTYVISLPSLGQWRHRRYFGNINSLETIHGRLDLV